MALTDSTIQPLKQRAKAAGLHFILTLLVAALSAALVFILWYPGEYRHIAGGQELFLLVVTIDIILGPLLTFAVFDLRKGWRHLRRDLSIIVLIQLSALSYGLYTVMVARPVALVFEGDRFRMVTAAEIYKPDLPNADKKYQSLPWMGPLILGTRVSKPGDEALEEQLLRQLGSGVGLRPIYWQDYEASRSEVIAKSKPLTALLARQAPERAARVRERLPAFGVAEAGARYAPLAARRGPWVVLLSGDGRVLGFEALDGDA